MTERNVYMEPEKRLVIRTADVYQTETEAGTIGYSEKLLSVVAAFSNSGAPEGYNARCMVGKSKRGEVAMRLYAVVDPKTERFVNVGFKSRGCLAMTACSSMIARMLEGKNLSEALAISADDLKDALDGVPWDRAYVVDIVMEGVKALVGDYLIRQGGGLSDLDEVVVCDDTCLSCILTEHCSLRDARIELKFGYLKEVSQNA